MARLLLNHEDIDVNKVDGINKMSALMIAVERGENEVVILLLRHLPTDVNMMDSKDDTATSIALKRGFLRTLKLLVRCPKTNVDNIGDSLLVLI